MYGVFVDWEFFLVVGLRVPPRPPPHKKNLEVHEVLVIFCLLIEKRVLFLVVQGVLPPNLLLVVQPLFYLRLP